MEKVNLLKAHFEEEVGRMDEEQMAHELLHFGKGLIVDLANPRRTLVQLKLRTFGSLSNADLAEIFPSIFAPRAISDCGAIPSGTSKSFQAQAE